MVSFRAARIYFRERLAGELREELPRGSRFVYDEAYLASGAPPVGLCLPTSHREHLWPDGLHPFFQHLGPEGHLRARQARWAHLSESDDLGLLLAFGADCIGAVSVRDAGTEPSKPSNEPPASEAWSAHRTISGRQSKMLVVGEGKYFRAAPAEGPAPYIAKLPEVDLEHIVANEAQTLEACQMLLGEEQVTTFVRGFVEEVSESCLVVRRFDRTPEGGKLRLEDFAQILVRPRGFDFGGKYVGSYEECAEVIRRWSARPLIDVAQFWRRLVVFVLLGNADAHLKNFSLLETPEGLRLSPVYDAVNTLFYASQGISTRLALELQGQHRQMETIDRPLLEAAGEAIGLNPRARKQILDDLAAREKRVWRLCQRESWLRDEARDRYADTVNAAWTRLFPR